MKLPSHLYLDELDIPYEARSFSPETEKGAANVAHVLGFSERQAVKTLIFEEQQELEQALLVTMLPIF
jgi:prolyl-tRNA editing enzyme YbaK/EbsC (Cys-tRNA(Pro) deacylase)